MTVQELIEASLRLIGSLANGETPESSELADGLEALNIMIGSWNATIRKDIAGRYASYLASFSAIATYSLVGDTVDTDEGLAEALKYNLAVALAAEFGRNLPAPVLEMAVVTKNALMTVGK